MFGLFTWNSTTHLFPSSESLGGRETDFSSDFFELEGALIASALTTDDLSSTGLFLVFHIISYFFLKT